MILVVSRILFGSETLGRGMLSFTILMVGKGKAHTNTACAARDVVGDGENGGRCGGFPDGVNGDSTVVSVTGDTNHIGVLVKVEYRAGRGAPHDFIFTALTHTN